LILICVRAFCRRLQTLLGQLYVDRLFSSTAAWNGVEAYPPAGRNEVHVELDQPVDMEENVSRGIVATNESERPVRVPRDNPACRLLLHTYVALPCLL
jgi:hypothetical protein